MKRSFLLALVLPFLVLSCEKNGGDDPEPDPVAVTFAKGADISWATEMVKKGYKFYGSSGTEMECTALMKALGMNAVRFRVWVDPADGWCGKDDVVAKAKLAKALGMRVLVDFHYSDSWADPSQQTLPFAWSGYSVSQIAAAVSSHTKEVLQALKTAGVDVGWVQVGNEVVQGMLWPTGKVSGNSMGSFPQYFNAGASAVREVYPDAKTILHLNNGWDLSTLQWFYNLAAINRLDYDIIGLSLYPSYWSGNSYPDWTEKTSQFVSNIKSLNASFSKPVMLVEFGMPATEPAKAKAALKYILSNTKDLDCFQGIFYWEPESEHDRNAYDYGAFSGGRPTEALDPFAN